MVPVLFLISIVTFVMMKATPGGPFDATSSGRELPKEIVDNLNRRYHLDEPNWKQYLIYMGFWPTTHSVQGFPCFVGIRAGGLSLGTKSVCHDVFKGVVQGDLGPSFQYKGRGVTEILFGVQAGRPFWESRFGRSAELGLFGFTIAVVLGIPLGVLAAVKHNSWIDYLSIFFATIWYSVPNFVLGVFLILFFGLALHLLPIVARSWDTPQAWILPSFALGAGLAASLARLTRAMMLEVLRQDYVRTARAKGLRERAVLYLHALRNALIPVATVLGPALAGLITGSFFVETLFSFPGMGRLFVQSIFQRDYSVIMGTAIFFAFLISLANLAVDLVYAWLDPRISYS